MTLSEVLNCDRLTAVVDVGASPIDGNPPYKAMLDSRLCRVVGFEPNPPALAKLNASKSDLETYHLEAIGLGDVRRAYLCRAPGMNSLLEPDPDVLKCFMPFPEWGKVNEEIPCRTRPLSDFSLTCDLLKIDIQGGELDAFRSGNVMMSKVVAVHTEVSFIPLYKDQPTIGEIDQELRYHGLVPHMFYAIKHWLLSPVQTSNTAIDQGNQLLEADMVYIRDFSKMDLMSDDQLKHLAMIAHYCYGSKDLVVRCLAWLAKRGIIPYMSGENYLVEAQKAKP